MMSQSCQFAATTNKMVSVKNKIDVYTDILSQEIILTRRKLRIALTTKKVFVNLVIFSMGAKINILTVSRMVLNFVKIIY